MTDSTESIDKSVDIFYLLGHICTAVEELTIVIDDGICAALPGTHNIEIENDETTIHKYAAGHLILAEMDLSKKIELLGILACLCLNDDETTILNDLLKRAHAVRTKRNERIHAIWLFDEGTPQMIKKEFWRKKVAKHGQLGPQIDIKPATLKEEVHEIRATSTELRNFLLKNELSLITDAHTPSGDKSP